LSLTVTYIISDINRSVAFEWIANNIDPERIRLRFILLNPSKSLLQQFLEEQGLPVTTIICKSKADWPRVILMLVKTLRRNRPDIIHCHLQQASILGLLAGKLAGINKRIYTRHHSSLHHVYFPKGVFWDKWCNSLATKIIAISDSVREILVDWEKASPSKVLVIPHGFKLGVFAGAGHELINELRIRHKIGNKYPVIGVVSRFTEWKGVQYIIPAFARILSEYPDAILLLFNAEGDFKSQISRQLAELPQESYRTISFESQMTAAYHLFDMLIHTPVDAYSEAFGQVYIEAMAAGVPLIATRSGIGNSILKHEENALVVGYKDSAAIAEGIRVLVTDKQLRARLIAAGRMTAKQFELDNMIGSLTNLYENA